jgi:hypothetical protein
MTQIAQKAILADLNISVWSATAQDKSASAKLCEDTGAQDGEGRVYKNVLSREALKPINDIARAARMYHRQHAMPWFEGGARLLPAKLIEEYELQMAKYQSDFEVAVSVFLARYDAHRNSQEQRLGDLFDEADYPSVDQVAGKFSFNTSFSGLPDTSDFRIELSEGQAEKMRRQIEKGLVEKQAAAQKAPLEELVGYIHNLAHQVGEYSRKDRAGETGRLYNSLVGNVQRVVDLLPAFNLDNNPEIEALAAGLKRELCAFSVEELKEDEVKRDKVAYQARKYAAKVADML